VAEAAVVGTGGLFWLLEQEEVVSDRAADLYRRLVLINELAASMNRARVEADLDGCLAEAVSVMFPLESVRICTRAGSDYSRRRLSGPGINGEEGVFPMDDGLAGVVLQSGQPLWVGDSRAAQAVIGSSSTIVAMPRSYIVAPFHAAGKAVGCLEVVSSRANRFDEVDYHLVLMVATHLSCSLENLLTRRELAEANEQLRANDERLKELNRILQDQAQRDEVTGLFNKRRLLEQIAAETTRARRYGELLACLMIDIDYFKQVNDELGHQAGDEVLRQFGALLHNRLRASDFVARYGGEEFTVLLPKTGQTGALRVAEQIRTCVDSHAFVLPMATVHITVSIGVSCCVQASQMESGKVLFRADTALYAAKGAGRNRVCVAGDDISDAPSQ